MPDPQDLQDAQSEAVEVPAIRPTRRTRQVQSETAFQWRLLAGFVGALAVIILQFVFFGPKIAGLWKEITQGLETGKGFVYLITLVLLGVVPLVCGLIAGGLNKSSIGALLLGAGLCAGLVCGLLIWRVKSDGAPDKWPTSLRLTEAVFTPELIDLSVKHQQEFRELSVTRAKIAELERTVADTKKDLNDTRQILKKLEDEMPSKLAEASKAASDAKAAELQPVIDLKNRELDALNKKAEAADVRIKELLDKSTELRSDLDARVKELVELRQKYKESQTKIEELQAKLSAVTPVDLPKPPASTTLPKTTK